VIREQMKDLKAARQAVAGESLVGMAGFAPPTMLVLGTRVAARIPQRNVTTVTTNVPGPQRSMFAMGRRVLETFPYVPIANTVRIGVAVVSYVGQLNVGVTGDYDTAPDIETLCRGVEDSMAELVEAAERAQTRCADVKARVTTHCAEQSHNRWGPRPAARSRGWGSNRSAWAVEGSAARASTCRRHGRTDCRVVGPPHR
jgi:hypothetical protein